MSQRWLIRITFSLALHGRIAAMQNGRINTLKYSSKRINQSMFITLIGWHMPSGLIFLQQTGFQVLMVSDDNAVPYVTFGNTVIYFVPFHTFTFEICKYIWIKSTYQFDNNKCTLSLSQTCWMNALWLGTWFVKEADEALYSRWGCNSNINKCNTAVGIHILVVCTEEKIFKKWVELCHISRWRSKVSYSLSILFVDYVWLCDMK